MPRPSPPRARGRHPSPPRLGRPAEICPGSRSFPSVAGRTLAGWACLGGDFLEHVLICAQFCRSAASVSLCAKSGPIVEHKLTFEPALLLLRGGFLGSLLGGCLLGRALLRRRLLRRRFLRGRLLGRPVRTVAATLAAGLDTVLELREQIRDVLGLVELLRLLFGGKRFAAFEFRLD